MESLAQFVDNVEFVEIENIMMVVNDNKKEVDFGLMDIEEWDICEQYSINDILAAVLGTYFSYKFQSESTVEEMVEKVTNIFVAEEYDWGYLDVIKCEGLCSGEVRYNFKLPDGSVVKTIEHMDSIYMTCGYHLWYVLSLLRDSKCLSGWIALCEDITYRHIGYYDLVQIEGTGHIPAPIALEKLGYEKILNMPVSNKVRDERFYKCNNCGHESFYHLHPCEICGEGYEKYSSEEKDRILMNENLVCEYVCADESYKYRTNTRTTRPMYIRTVQKKEQDLETLDNIKSGIRPHISWIKEQIEKSPDKTIRIKTEDVADELGLIDQDEEDIYQELRRVLHNEGIIVDTGEHNSGEALLIMTMNSQEE